MAGTVTGTIGNNSGVFFQYSGTAAALHMDIGFQPSMVEMRATTLSWTWNSQQGYADVATINGWELGVAGVGRRVTTTTDVASIQGIQIGTDTLVNGTGYLYRGLCWR